MKNHLFDFKKLADYLILRYLNCIAIDKYLIWYTVNYLKMGKTFFAYHNGLKSID